MDKTNIKVELTEDVLNKNLSESSKNRIIEYENWKAENEIIRQKMDGEIKCKSELGNGSLFEFFICIGCSKEDDGVSVTDDC